MLVHPRQVTEDDNSIGPTTLLMNTTVDHLNVIVVGQAGIGKSSLIKLLLDTSHLSQNTTPPLLARLAEFANFAATHPTSSPSSIIAQLPTSQDNPDILLNLIDTPGLLYHDSQELEAGLHLVLRYIFDSFAASTTTDQQLAQERRDKQIHLCLYLLDPADIIPASTRHLRRPERYGVSPQLTRQRVQLSAMRARTGVGPTASAGIAVGGEIAEGTRGTEGASTEEMPHYDDSPEDEWGRATVPTSELNILKRLSEYVTVLPILAKADTLTIERLDAVKRAVRRDLMEAGINLGPFESGSRGSGALLNTPPPDGGAVGAADAGSPLLPYAIMIPDRYHHGDGVLRAGTTARLTHHQYVSRYQEISVQEQDQESTATPFVQRDDLVRTYRWGTINILDPSVSDFLALREAILGSFVQVLRARTDEIFYETYRRNVLTDSRYGRDAREHREHRELRAPPTLARPHSSTSASASGRSLRPNPPVPPHSLEVYKTNTRSLYPQAQAQALNPSSSPYSLAPLASMAPLENIAGNVGRQGPPTLTPLSTMLHTSLKYKHSNQTLTSPDDDAPRSPGPSPILPPKHRTGRKVAVACNFCRSRKLKCDGGRPQCLQCIRRTVDCEYEPTAKRRGLAKPSEINAQHAAEFRGSSPIPQGQVEVAVPPKSVACQFCRARKTRCDGLQPQCSNCKKRNQECVYTYGAGYSEEEGNTPSATAAVAPRRFPPSTVGVTSLPPIQSLPLGAALSDSLPPSSYWHSSSPQLHTALPTRRPHLSPSSRTRSIPGPAQSFPLSRHQHQIEGDSLRGFGTFPPPPPSGYPTPYTSETRRPSTSGADSQTWRDRSSFSSTSTRGGMSATATPSTPGLKRKASHPGEEEGEGEVIRLGASGESPSPPKRRRISGGDEAFVSTVSTASAISAERHRRRERPEREEEEEEEDSEAAA